eukprot:UN04093
MILNIVTGIIAFQMDWELTNGINNCIALFICSLLLSIIDLEIAYYIITTFNFWFKFYILITLVIARFYEFSLRP